MLGSTISQKTQLVDLLYQTTQGNPLFVTEALRALHERQLLSSARSTVHSVSDHSKDEGQQPLAETTEAMLGLMQNPRIQEIILERIRRLSPTTRNVLHLCAVIGRDFSLELLEQSVTDAELEQLVTEIEILLQRKFLLERADERLDFSHQIVRQVAYEHMSVIQRRRLHLRVAKALTASARAVRSSR